MIQKITSNGTPYTNEQWAGWWDTDAGERAIAWNGLVLSKGADTSKEPRNSADRNK